MGYGFYGWKTADIRPQATGYEAVTDPRKMYDILSLIWNSETCAPRMRDAWTPENRTLGQCSITAFLVQDVFGGKVYGIPLKDGGVHCYNVVEDCVFDLTSEQFGQERLCYENNPEQLREVHFASEEKRGRYEYLKVRFDELARLRLDCFPKIPLGVFPTPLYRLENISRELNTNVWIKRDDMCGIALGGNKVRKLEYLLADAKNKGYELVMTTGQAQSNHAMLTAACALKTGMECVLVLKKRGVTARVGNQVLNHLMGTEVRFVDTDSYDDIYAEMDRIADGKGKPVYKIPCGGSNALGSLGYVDCMREVAASGIRFTHIVCACGSGGTAAGTTLGARIYMPDTHVICSAVDTDPFERIVSDLMKETAALIGYTGSIPAPDIIPMSGSGYSIPSAEGNAAIRFMLQKEGVVLDTCYTGKAFAGLLKCARENRFGPDDNVLFVHTGGAGGLFAQNWEDD